jgi:phytoene dehydrogenase-like protein
MAISETDDMDIAYETFGKLEPPKYLVAGCYNHVYEDISPPGTAQLCITTLQMGKIWQNISADQYFKVKDYLADKMVDVIEKTICPDVRDHIEIAEAATPLTYYRYSKNMEGAIYGYTQDLLDGPNLRLKSRGSIPGLYQCGAWTNIGGGFSASILSGRIAAGMYLKDSKEGRW